jgi:hypothetical protein
MIIEYIIPLFVTLVANVFPLSPEKIVLVVLQIEPMVDMLACTIPLRYTPAPVFKMYAI